MNSDLRDSMNGKMLSLAGSGGMWTVDKMVDVCLSASRTTAAIGGGYLLGTHSLEDIECGVSPLDVERFTGRPFGCSIMRPCANASFPQVYRVHRATRADLRRFSLRREFMGDVPPRDLFVYSISDEDDAREFLIGFRGGRWVMGRVLSELHFLGKNIFEGLPGDAMTALEADLSILPGVVTASRYWWKAKFLGPRAHAVVPVSAEGARDLFKTRHVEPGQRRKALVHLVSSHSRRSTRDVEHEVREHLRGVQSFEWGGLPVRLDPSEFDRERVEAVS